MLAKGAKATGAQRKKAIVAVARHLAVALWRISTGRCTAAQLGLRNPEPQATQSARIAAWPPRGFAPFRFTAWPRSGFMLLHPTA